MKKTLIDGKDFTLFEKLSDTVQAIPPDMNKAKINTMVVIANTTDLYHALNTGEKVILKVKEETFVATLETKEENNKLLFSIHST